MARTKPIKVKKSVQKKAEKESGKLTFKQQRFCEEYIMDWNATRAAKVAGYSEKTAPFIGAENLKKPQIKDYISYIQADIAKLTGISRARVLNEYKKMAFTSIADLHNTWIDLKEFEELTDEQKASIAEVSSRSRKLKDGTVFKEVKLKLHDKSKALENINKMLGYNEAEKVEHSGNVGLEVSSKTMEELDKELAELEALQNKKK